MAKTRARDRSILLTKQDMLRLEDEVKEAVELGTSAPMLRWLLSLVYWKGAAAYARGYSRGYRAAWVSQESEARVMKATELALKRMLAQHYGSPEEEQDEHLDGLVDDAAVASEVEPDRFDFDLFELDPEVPEPPLATQPSRNGATSKS